MDYVDLRSANSSVIKTVILCSGCRNRLKLTTGNTWELALWLKHATKQVSVASLQRLEH